ncbi:hypothetical protein EV175_005903 [Coemansia sp. RSA 1933]|nr:hypothetical protein EV175_005903 [Coemansia sp. RSA 1933]
MKCLLLRTFPLDADEYDAVGLFFWSTVGSSWLLSFAGLFLREGRRNFSIVDRLWPVFPALLVLQWVLFSPVPMGPKALVVQTLVLVWSMRLTYNSVRRGDYALGAEDYRWVHVRRWFPNALAWEAFNVLFISGFQVSLLYLLAKPIRHITALEPNSSAAMAWTAAELGLAAAMVLFLAIEAVADQQQFNYQVWKRQNPDSESAGFVHTGLWRFSRHPNVFCEQAFWLCIAWFCALATDADLGVASVAAEFLGGPLLLVALMWGSVGLAETISASKYPLYQAYQVKTSRLVPWVPWSNARVISQAHRARS